MKNVVIFNDHWCSGGVESLWTNLLKNMPSSDYKFTILVSQKETDIYDEVLNSLGIKVVTILNKAYSNPIIRTKKNLKAFKSAIIRLNPDILHINSCNASGLKLAHIAYKNGIKNVIVHSHNTMIEHDKLGLKLMAHNWWKKKYIKSPHYEFGCSTESLKFMFDNTNGYLLKNGVDLDKFKYYNVVRVGLRNQYNYSNDDFVIGHIGRFCKQKNHRRLIEIFNDYIKVNPKAKLFLIGEGELKEEIKNLVDELSLTNSVVFAGTFSDVYRYYSMFDMFLLPSLHEGLPVVAIEAEAAGLPVVMADTITKEAKVNDNVCYQSLEACWNDAIERNRGKREYSQSNIVDAGFDIKDSSRKLIEYYNNL